MSLVTIPEAFPDTLTWWREQFFSLQFTTSEGSQKKQWRHIEMFIRFMLGTTGNEERKLWTPRLSRDFLTTLKKKTDGTARATDTIDNVLNHVRSFAKWIHHLKPFPFGNPMAKIKNVRSLKNWGSRSLTPQERNRMLDSADYLPISWGKSKDRERYGLHPESRPTRKTARPYRNRAIIYTLIETGMRREAVTNIELEKINFREGTIEVIEKGDLEASYTITQAGLRAIEDYLEHERSEDSDLWGSPYLFLPAHQQTQSSGKFRKAHSTQYQFTLESNSRTCQCSQGTDSTLSTARRRGCHHEENQKPESRIGTTESCERSQFAFLYGRDEK